MTSSSTQGAAPLAVCWFQKILDWLWCVWEVVQDFGQVLKYARLSLLITLLVGLALIFVPQGQDLIVIHAERSGFPLFFYSAVIFWALNAWYWARSILEHGPRFHYEKFCEKPWFGGRKERVNFLARHLPRAIGTGAFLMVAIAQFMAASREGIGSAERSTLLVFAAISVGLAAVFYGFTFWRRNLSSRIGNRVKTLRSMKSGPQWLMLTGSPKYGEATPQSELPASVKLSFVVLSLILAVLFILVSINLTALDFLGPDVVFLICGSLWIVPGSWVLFRSKSIDFPVLTFIILIALVFSPFNDNHTLRQIEDRPPVGPGQRLDPQVALTVWQESQSEAPAGRPTLVMVATAGGGSRAAYWTASVLGTIQDLHPGFDGQLFGISGVSGGSVGAAMYRGLLTALPDSQAACTAGAPGGRTYRHCARTILGKDFLSSTLSATLLPDLVQRLLFWDALPDRAKGLEEAWEAAWREAIGPNDHQDLLARDFLAAWPDKSAGQVRSILPALFLNGTSVATGKRVVTSNLDVSYSLTDAYDLFSHWPMTIRMSTAANNSARFPYIGPAGTMHRVPTEQDPEAFDRIVDGGYFENFGAATTLDLLQAVTGTRCLETADSCEYDVVVIQISSDPGYPGVAPSQGSTPQGGDGPGSIAAELTSPIKTLLNTRGARGVLAAQRLHNWTLDQLPGTARFFEFRLDIPEEETAPPLGWTLSEAATKTMDCQFLRLSNRSNLEELGQRLGFDPSAFLEDLERPSFAADRGTPESMPPCIRLRGRRQ